MLLPLLWMISTSLKDPGEVLLLPPKWISIPLQWGNYPKLFEVLPFDLFLMRQFYLTNPQELVEAARIDGCNFIQIYYRIFLPLSKPALATLGIFTFLGSWNNLMGPLIFLTKVETMTITLGLTLLTNQAGGRWELIQAGAVISILPIIVMFFIGQEHFIQGIARTGIKG